MEDENKNPKVSHSILQESNWSETEMLRVLNSATITVPNQWNPQQERLPPIANTMKAHFQDCERYVFI